MVVSLRLAWPIGGPLLANRMGIPIETGKGTIRVNKQRFTLCCCACKLALLEDIVNEDRRADYRRLQELRRAHNHRQMGSHLQRNHRKHNAPNGKLLQANPSRAQGLNGSGKSNILDAICFVLGITNMSTVRAQNLQDLIYKRGQAGVTKASVTIVFDNKDTRKSPIGFEEYAQISVTRQVLLPISSPLLLRLTISGRS